MCTAGCCCPCLEIEEMPIVDVATSETVGKISRFPLTVAECCGKFNRFEVKFNSLKENIKARKLLLGVAFMVDILYWDPGDE